MVPQGLSHTCTHTQSPPQMMNFRYEVSDSTLIDSYFTSLILIVVQDGTGTKKPDLIKTTSQKAVQVPVFKEVYINDKNYMMSHCKAG